MFDHYYSDPHFGHANVIRYCDRPFADLEEMHAELISRYAAAVVDDETVLWLGDAFFMRPDAAGEILRQLPGGKALLLGNHDKHTKTAYLRMGFDAVFDSDFLIGIEGFRVRVSHYPYQGADPAYDQRYLDRRPLRQKGEFLLHGHCHSKPGSAVRPDQRMIDVGVDAWDYGPVHSVKVADALRGMSDGRLRERADPDR